MLILGKRKHSVSTILAVFIIFISKSTSDEGMQTKEDSADKGMPVQAAPVTLKAQEVKFAEKDSSPSISDDKSEDVKAEKCDQLSNPNDKEENQFAKPEENEQPPGVAGSDSKQSNEQVEGSEQQPSAPKEETVEDSKSEETDHSPQKLEEDAKKQNVKIEENNRKISLSDVNSVTYDDSKTKETKRETRNSPEFLGLPRDASYFFDDLEPFINNNSAKDNMREGRAIPSRENKSQKSKLGGKKDNLDDDADEEEDDENEKVEEEEEKANEGDYDDDEDIEPDCQMTEGCTSSTECDRTTTGCPHTTPCPTTPRCTATTAKKCTSKCTTKLMCPTKCPTTVECTKCPKICAKGDRKQIHYPIMAEKTLSWDSNKKRMKKKFQSKVNPE